MGLGVLFADDSFKEADFVLAKTEDVVGDVEEALIGVEDGLDEEE